MPCASLPCAGAGGLCLHGVNVVRASRPTGAVIDCACQGSRVCEVVAIEAEATSAQPELQRALGVPAMHAGVCGRGRW